MSSARTYQHAVEHLNSLQYNAAQEAVPASKNRLQESGIPDMLEYLDWLGYCPNDLNALNVIHITGTKGKGSTSAFVNSILQHTKPSWKVGLFTSPHLITVRERIRINGKLISEGDFTKYFFEVWDKLVTGVEHKRKTHSSSKTFMPGYFRFLTLLAFHIFLDLKIDATVLEVGVGGAYDGTNIVPRPRVTGITALGIDHVSVLGNTLKEIAWHKGGIFKEGAPAITVTQPSEGMEVLEARARELKASSFSVVQTSNALAKIPLGLAGQHQVQNATIAVELARKFLEDRDALEFTIELPQSFVDGLAATRWPGRCQTIIDPVRGNLTWYLDGAHTIESLNCCMDWVLSLGVGIEPKDISASSRRILVFNCTKGRTGQTFLAEIYKRITAWTDKNGCSPARFFDHVVFCANVTYADGRFKTEYTSKVVPKGEFDQAITQHELAAAWTSIVTDYPRENVHVHRSIEDAINQINKINDGTGPVKILVTGSLHLVGGVIEVAGLSGVAL